MKLKPINFKCECGKEHTIHLDDIQKRFEEDTLNKIEEALFKNGK